MKVTVWRVNFCSVARFEWCTEVHKGVSIKWAARRQLSIHTWETTPELPASPKRKDSGSVPKKQMLTVLQHFLQQSHDLFDWFIVSKYLWFQIDPLRWFLLPRQQHKAIECYILQFLSWLLFTSFFLPETHQCVGSGKSICTGVSNGNSLLQLKLSALLHDIT